MEVKKKQKIIIRLSYFLHEIDISANKPAGSVLSFFFPLTIFSVNDEVTRFDGTYSV